MKNISVGVSIIMCRRWRDSGMYLKIFMPSHGLNQKDVGSIFIFKDRKFIPMPVDDRMKRSLMDWTVIESIIDDDNFNCWSGEAEAFKLATNLKELEG